MFVVVIALLLTQACLCVHAETSASAFLAQLRNGRAASGLSAAANNDSNDAAAEVFFESHARPQFETDYVYNVGALVGGLAIYGYVARILWAARRRYKGHCELALPLDYALQKKLLASEKPVN